MVCGCLDQCCVHRCSGQCDVHVLSGKHRSQGNTKQSIILVAAGWQKPLSTGNQAEAFFLIRPTGQVFPVNSILLSSAQQNTWETQKLTHSTQYAVTPAYCVKTA